MALLAKRRIMNLIIINTHDTGTYSNVYCGGGKTPNLEEFSRDCTVFDNAFCVSPTCSPSRGAMLTGEYPTANGLMGLAHRGFVIEDKLRHIASYLGGCGYETVLSGIQHENGFWLDPRHALPLGYQKIITDYNLKGTTVDDYMTWDNLNAKRVAGYLKTRDKSKPFYLSYGTFSTHRGYPSVCDGEYENSVLPHGMAENDENIKDTRQLARSLKNFDDNVKIIVDALKESGEYDDTLIVITTDHGLANPLEKCTLECGGTHVMLLMRHPNIANMRGERCFANVSHLDVFPTICDVLGVEKPAWLEGKSFATCFEKDCEINDYTFHELNFHTSYEPARCVRSKDFLYIEYLHSFDDFNLSNIDESPQKNQMIENGELSKKKDMVRFYDLRVDKYEKNNLIGDEKYACEIAKYKNLLGDWMKGRCDKVLTPEDYKASYQVNKMTCRYPSIKSEDDVDR